MSEQVQDKHHHRRLIERAQAEQRERLRSALGPALTGQALAIRVALTASAGGEAQTRRMQALQSGLREGSAIDADMFLLPQNWNLRFEFETRFDHIDDHPDGGMWVKKRRGRRVSNPFQVLLASGGLTKAQAMAGERLVALYAASKGLDGGPDTSDAGRVQKERPDPHVTALLRALDGNRYADILTRIDNPRYKKLLRAVVHDVVCGDGAGAVAVVRQAMAIKKGRFTLHKVGKAMREIKDGARWRKVIELTVGLRDDEAQARAMRRACDYLLSALREHDIEYTRQLRKKRVG